MKSLINTNALLFVMLASLLMMVSCSRGYRLSEKKCTYHLHLVKADKIKVPSESNHTEREYTVAEIMPVKSALTGSKQSNPLHYVQPVLPLSANKRLQLCSVASNSAKTIKPLNTERINYNRVNYYNSWGDDDNDLIMNPPRIILIAGILALATVACFLLVSQAPFLYLVGSLLAVAAVVFLVIWLLSLRDYHTF